MAYKTSVACGCLIFGIVLITGSEEMLGFGKWVTFFVGGGLLGLFTGIVLER